MENQEKQQSFFVKHLETIGTLITILGIIIFCLVYQPRIVQPVLDFIGLKKIDANTPVNIDKAIAHFSKEANKKIPKGSHVIVRKTDLRTPNNAIKDYIHLKIKQNFAERNDINVYGNNDIVVQDIKDGGDIFTISARLEEFDGVSSVRPIDKFIDKHDYGDYYDYKFFISMDKNGSKEATDQSVLIMDYAIVDDNLYNIKEKNDEVEDDSSTEQECIVELEESLLYPLIYYNYYDGKLSKQIEILYGDKNCVRELCDEKGKCEPCIYKESSNPDDYIYKSNCKYKSKCFSYESKSKCDDAGYEFCEDLYIKSNLSIKDCPTGSIWKSDFCDPYVEGILYSVPENPACINITPKRVKDNTTFKSKLNLK